MTPEAFPVFAGTERRSQDMQRTSDAPLAASLPGDLRNGYAEGNGTRIHYVEGGKGTPVLLLPGWPQTWWEFHKIMPELAKRHRVIAVDLRGMGGERNYPYLRELLPTQASDVRVVKVNSSSHYVPEDQPEAVVRELLGFFKSKGLIFTTSNR